MRDQPYTRGARLLVAALAWLHSSCGEPASVGRGTPCVGLAPTALVLPELDVDSPGVSRRNLRAWVELLASPRLEGRHAGEAGAREAAALLAAQMAAFGLVPPWPAGYCQGFPVFDAEDFNVVGHRTGPGAGARPAVLVGAHYDGQGRHPAGAIYPGADDNASGVAALLEVARLAGRHAAGPGVDWVFAALGGEEVGRLGAKAYLAAPSLDLARVELVIDLDMVGRPFPAGDPEAIGFLAVDGSPAADGSPPATLALLRRAAALTGVEVADLAGLDGSRPGISDAEVFATRLPTVLLSTALHAEHHELGDVAERVDDAQVERAARLVLALADILAGRR